MKDDLISRQDAIEALGEMPEVWEEDDDEGRGEQNQWYMDKIAIEALPSAEPRKGKWIVQITGWGDVYYECSCCKEAFTLIEGTPTVNNYYYCPNCGARMEE